LPAMANPAPPAAPRPQRRASETVARPTAPPPVGGTGGPAPGGGAVALNGSDFPFAWYVRTVHAKITERWAGRAIPGQQPVAVFDIGRDGRISGLAIEKSSGNTYYDQAALRAITEAAPFPPLPAEFGGQALGVKLGF